MIVRTTTGRGFGGLIAYITHDAPTDDIRHPESSSRVAWTHTENLPTDDPVLAGLVMNGVARDAPMLKQLAGVSARGPQAQRSPPAPHAVVATRREPRQAGDALRSERSPESSRAGRAPSGLRLSPPTATTSTCTSRSTASAPRTAAPSTCGSAAACCRPGPSSTSGTTGKYRSLTASRAARPWPKAGSRRRCNAPAPAPAAALASRPSAAGGAATTNASVPPPRPPGKPGASPTPPSNAGVESGARAVSG